MFAKILVPLDRSLLAAGVLPHAIALARCFDAQLILLHVLSRLDKQDRLRAVDPLEWQLRRAEAESYLQGVSVRVREAGVSCEAQVNDGDAAEQIVDCARANEVGLVLIASHGQSGLSDWRISSVVQKVIVRASASLMIVRAYISRLRQTSPAYATSGCWRLWTARRVPNACSPWPLAWLVCQGPRSCWHTSYSGHPCPGARRPVGRTPNWPIASWSATGARPNSILMWCAPNCRPPP